MVIFNFEQFTKAREAGFSLEEILQKSIKTSAQITRETIRPVMPSPAVIESIYRENIILKQFALSLAMKYEPEIARGLASCFTSACSTRSTQDMRSWQTNTRTL